MWVRKDDRGNQNHNDTYLNRDQTYIQGSKSISRQSGQPCTQSGRGTKLLDILSNSYRMQEDSKHGKILDILIKDRNKKKNHKYWTTCKQNINKSRSYAIYHKGLGHFKCYINVRNQELRSLSYSSLQKWSQVKIEGFEVRWIAKNSYLMRSHKRRRLGATWGFLLLLQLHRNRSIKRFQQDELTQKEQRYLKQL